MKPDGCWYSRERRRASGLRRQQTRWLRPRTQRRPAPAADHPGRKEQKEHWCQRHGEDASQDDNRDDRRKGDQRPGDDEQQASENRLHQQQREQQQAKDQAQREEDTPIAER